MMTNKHLQQTLKHLFARATKQAHLRLQKAGAISTTITAEVRIFETKDPVFKLQLTPCFYNQKLDSRGPVMESKCFTVIDIDALLGQAERFISALQSDNPTSETISL